MTTGNLTLYDFELDEDCYRARLTLSLLGLKYKRIAVDMFPGKEHLQPHMLALSPEGQMPVLDFGPKKVFEADKNGQLRENMKPSIYAGLGVMVLLLNHHRQQWLLPHNPRHGVQLVFSWSDFMAKDLAPARDARLAALFGLSGDLAVLTAGAHKALRAMDDMMTHRHFEGGEWFVGDHPTIADIVLFPTFALSRDYGLGHEELPALRRWARRVRQLPGFITMPGIPEYA